MAADIDPNHRGMEYWAGGATGGIHSSVTGETISGSPIEQNMACWWDGGLLRNMMDGKNFKDDTGMAVPVIRRYNYETMKTEELIAMNGCTTSNHSKQNPCLQADILGDWREEVMVRTEDNKAIRIYLTTYPTEYRFHTFLEDPVYRMSVVYQNVAYNQPTQTGFYFGADLENIFEEKKIRVEERSCTLDPVFEALSYKWSTGETSRQLNLNSTDFESEKEYKIYLDMNFRGHNFSDTVYVTFANGSAVNDIYGREGVVLEQTVVSDELSLKVPSLGTYQVNIFNAAGTLFNTQQVTVTDNHYRINVATLPKGIYILSISGNQETYTFRFIKN